MTIPVKMNTLLAGLLLSISAVGAGATDSDSATMGVSLVIVSSPEEHMAEASATMQDNSGRVTHLTLQQRLELLYDPQKVVKDAQPDADGVVRITVRFGF